MTAMTASGRKRLRRERERLESALEDGGGEINLVPYLDIVTNILMFLIVTAQAMLTVANIEVVLPEYSQSSGGADDKKDEKPPLNLTVTITGKGFTVAGSDGALGVVYQDDIPGKLPTVPMAADGRYDFTKLQSLLVKIKLRFAKEESAILSANPDIPYETIIGVMDVLRAGPDKNPLFPKVLFSTGIQ
ncbi:MAG: biopolymer transporter ExbD [Deltaproteobacteria bacterium]|nr:biopolymer transporter ExbD [Deltaproteobacteria bacterium]